MARHFFRLGISLAEQSRIPLAMQALKCSYTAHPHPDTYYNYGKLAEKSSRYAEAIAGYRRYLKLNRFARDRVEVEEKIEILEKALAQKAREAEVRELADRLARDKVDALQREHRARELARKEADEKRRALLQAKLSDIEARRAAEKLELERRWTSVKLAERRRKLSTVAWIVAGASAAALVVAGVMGSLALVNKDKVENGRQDEPWRGDIAEAYDRNRSYSLVSYISAGAGALLAVGAGVFFGLSRRITVEPEAPPRPRLRLIPLAGPVGGGAEVVVTF